MPEIYSDSEYIEFHKGTHKNLGWTNPLKEYRHEDENLERVRRESSEYFFEHTEYKLSACPCRQKGQSHDNVLQRVYSSPHLCADCCVQF